MTNPVLFKIAGEKPALIAGHHGIEFALNSHRAFAIFPAVPAIAGSQPWVWYAPT